MEDPCNARVIDRQDLTEALSILRIAPDHGQAPPFEPGQFINLGLPKVLDESDPVVARLRERGSRRVPMTRRAYSIASSAREREYLEFFMVLVEQGRLTPRVWDLPIGGRLWMDEKCSGHFTLEGVPTDAELVMVSTGTGLAPYVSMLRTYRGQNRWRRLVLIHGVRYAADLAYCAELEAVAREDPTVVYIPTVTREPAESPWRGLRGRVQQVLEPEAFQRLAGVPLDPLKAHVFLCGNPEMIQTVEPLLKDRGFALDSHEQAGNLHFERYW